MSGLTLLTALLTPFTRYCSLGDVNRPPRDIEPLEELASSSVVYSDMIPRCGEGCVVGSCTFPLVARSCTTGV